MLLHTKDLLQLRPPCRLKFSVALILFSCSDTLRLTFGLHFIKTTENWNLLTGLFCTIQSESKHGENKKQRKSGVSVSIIPKPSSVAAAADSFSFKART